MVLNGKHSIIEIEGIRCTVVETGISEERKTFLTDLLTFNGFRVLSIQEKEKDGAPLNTYVTGITDLVVNPVILLYEHKLLRPDGIEVTPAYWNQKNDQTTIPYWQVK